MIRSVATHLWFRSWPTMGGRANLEQTFQIWNHEQYISANNLVCVDHKGVAGESDKGELLFINWNLIKIYCLLHIRSYEESFWVCYDLATWPGESNRNRSFRRLVETYSIPRLGNCTSRLQSHLNKHYHAKSRFPWLRCYEKIPKFIFKIW